MYIVIIMFKVQIMTLVIFIGILGEFISTNLILFSNLN